MKCLRQVTDLMLARQPSKQGDHSVPPRLVLCISFWRYLLFVFIFFLRKKAISNLFQWKKKELLLTPTLRNLAWNFSSCSPPLITDIAQLLNRCHDFWFVWRAEPMFLEVNQSNKLMWNSFVGLHFLMLHKVRLWIVLGSGKNHGEYFLRFQSQWGI